MGQGDGCGPVCGGRKVDASQPGYLKCRLAAVRVDVCAQASAQLDDFTGSGKFVLGFELKARLCGKCPMLTILFPKFKR